MKAKERELTKKIVELGQQEKATKIYDQWLSKTFTGIAQTMAEQWV